MPKMHLYLLPFTMEMCLKNLYTLLSRSRDVAELHANMTFDPVKINLQQSQHQCEHGGHKSICVKTEVCFAYSVKSDQQDPNSAAGEPIRVIEC